MKLKLTESEKIELVKLFAQNQCRTACSWIETKVNQAWAPEALRWIPVTERMPTAEDGLNGSTAPCDNGFVCWMTTGGIIYSNWDYGHSPDPIAWCRIPDYVPPVPTPEEEDPVRASFEKWAIIELDDLNRIVGGHYESESVQCAWAAWQAARAEGGKP